MPIGTCHGRTPFTTQEVADLTGCSPNRSTAKVRNLAQRIVTAALADPRLWATTGRPDRVARALTEFVITAGALAAGDPASFQLWIRDLLENGRAPEEPPNPPRADGRPAGADCR